MLLYVTKKSENDRISSKTPEFIRYTTLRNVTIWGKIKAKGVLKMNEVFTMTPLEYSKRTRIGIGTIRRLAKVKGFPTVRVGRKMLIPVKAADAWILAAGEVRGK